MVLDQAKKSIIPFAFNHQLKFQDCVRPSVRHSCFIQVLFPQGLVQHSLKCILFLFPTHRNSALPRVLVWYKACFFSQNESNMHLRPTANGLLYLTQRVILSFCSPYSHGCAITNTHTHACNGLSLPLLLLCVCVILWILVLLSFVPHYPGPPCGFWLIGHPYTARVQSYLSLPPITHARTRTHHPGHGLVLH